MRMTLHYLKNVNNDKSEIEKMQTFIEQNPSLPQSVLTKIEAAKIASQKCLNNE